MFPQTEDAERFALWMVYFVLQSAQQSCSNNGESIYHNGGVFHSVQHVSKKEGYHCCDWLQIFVGSRENDSNLEETLCGDLYSEEGPTTREHSYDSNYLKLL